MREAIEQLQYETKSAISKLLRIEILNDYAKGQMSILCEINKRLNEILNK